MCVCVCLFVCLCIQKPSETVANKNYLIIIKIYINQYFEFIAKII